MAHVLIVDDEKVSRDIVKSMLDEMGASYDEAVDGNQALSMLENHTFDLVLLDVLMPNEDGIGVLLKTKSRGDKTPIVVLTGASMGEGGPSYSEYAERLGASLGIEKPITMDKLEAALSYAKAS